MVTQGIQEHLIHGSHPRDWSWNFWPLVPLYPYRKRRTLCREVVEDTIWTFDQMQGILYTVVPIRMTIIRLEAGGLLVYAPVAPTTECIRMLRELEAKFGEIKYIILPTTSGLEHKVFVGPFARHFQNAQVFVTPNQWSYPINLPLNWLGFPKDRTCVLPEDRRQVPFNDEFDYALLDIDLGRGSFGEVALLHRRSRTLIVTDTVLSVSEEPPAIFQLDPYPLLFHARDSATEPIADTPENRRKGWQRIALFAAYFRPGAVETLDWGTAIRNALKAPDHSPKAYLGLYPFKWREDWQRSFVALCGHGRPFLAPILQLLILDHAPDKVLAWADQIASWDFCRIIPCHFDAPVEATPQQFRQIFTVFESTTFEHHSLFGSENQPLPTADIRFIAELEERLDKLGMTSPPKSMI